MYNKTSDDKSVNSCRKHLFTMKGRNIDYIPPTEGALIQHIRRAVYLSQKYPTSSEWGWKWENEM